MRTPACIFSHSSAAPKLLPSEPFCSLPGWCHPGLKVLTRLLGPGLLALVSAWFDHGVGTGGEPPASSSSSVVRGKKGWGKRGVETEMRNKAESKIKNKAKVLKHMMVLLYPDGQNQKCVPQAPLGLTQAVFTKSMLLTETLSVSSHEFSQEIKL